MSVIVALEECGDWKERRRGALLHIRDLSVAFDWFGRVSYGPTRFPSCFLLLVGEEGSIKLASFERREDHVVTVLEIGHSLSHCFLETNVEFNSHPSLSELIAIGKGEEKWLSFSDISGKRWEEYKLFDDRRSNENVETLNAVSGSILQRS